MSITLLSHPGRGRGPRRPDAGVGAAVRLLPPPQSRPELRYGAVLTVDLGAVAANTARFAARISGALMAVVKADGFGHGGTDIAGTALANGATWLGVTTWEEGLALRRSGLRAPILSWLNPVDADFASALRYDLDLAVPSVAHLEAVVAAARSGRGDQGPARIHLHLDTGMARDGAAPDEWPDLCRRARLAQQRRLVQVTGVMGHHGCADIAGDPRAVAARQAFARGLADAETAGLRPVVRHLAATSAAITDPHSHYDLCRVGAGLVGIDPTRSARLHPAITLTAPVVSVRRVPAATGVGYGHTYVTGRATTLALLPLGYADGLPRAASGRAEVLLNGRRRPIVGTISMDQIVVDAGDDPVGPGDVAVVFGPGGDAPTVREWADWSGTIEHEIVTGLGPRVSRAIR